MKKFVFTPIVVFLATTSMLAQIDDMRKGFMHPPESARPWVYWMWMDGNVTREGLTADLLAMKRVGIGGAIIMEVNVGIPRGPVAFMSPAWQDLFKHVINEAERLGIQITLNGGPGWTGSGGPWVRPEQSMQHIVGRDIMVKGPTRFSGILPRPVRRPAFFGDGALPPELEKSKNDFYRDVAVLAFPRGVAITRIKEIDEKALYVRAPYSSQPGVRPYIPTAESYPPLKADSVILTESIVDLSDSLTVDGRLTWNVPSGDWTIMRFGRTSTGANTRPAPIPGVGLECDKMDTAALNAHFDAFIGTLLRALGPRKRVEAGGLKMLHIDSWEMGAQNWTSAFRKEFTRRRGYDPLRYLPTVTGLVVGNNEVSERFLWDLRQTAQELVLENHAAHLRELAHQHGFGLSIEPYDMTPCADMSLGSLADVPMCEFWLYGFNTTYSVIEATSIAHTAGRPVVAAESFTSSDAEAWQAYPGSMKALGDWAFCAGVNRIVFHRYQHQPWLGFSPGMTMGPYGVHWERTQTWWGMSSGYHEYLSRCQYMLRLGLPVADVCYLVAEGAPQVFRAPPSATRGSPPDRREFNFDGCAPEIVLKQMSVANGRLTLPGGMNYRLLILPEQSTMTPPLLQKITQLVEAGATVIGPPPAKSPSLAGYPLCDQQIQDLTGKLWGDCDGLRITEHRQGKGRIIWNKRDPVNRDSVGDKKGDPLNGNQYGDFAIATQVLGRMGVLPDFESDAFLRYTHRNDKGTDIYFVANPEERPVAAKCTFRVSNKQPEVWDPVRGEVSDLVGFTNSGERTTVVLQFDPHQSYFLVFRKPAAQSGHSGVNSPDMLTVTTIGGPWELSFDRHWGGPERITFTALEDWSKRQEPGIKYYSGVATYRKSFDAVGFKEAVLERGGKSHRRVWLDLGIVDNLATVVLNDRDLGVVWCAPWRVEVTGILKLKNNSLVISVANLWPNRLIGDEQSPPDCQFGSGGNLERWPDWLLKVEPRPNTGRFAFTTWKHYSKDSPLLPSGLLGPVTLVSSKR